ncbi:MAG: hypothetical protein ABI569_03180 [Casimicrobiaceae bacterium]
MNARLAREHAMRWRPEAVVRDQALGGIEQRVASDGAAHDDGFMRQYFHRIVPGCEIDEVSRAALPSTHAVRRCH